LLGSTLHEPTAFLQAWSQLHHYDHLSKAFLTWDGQIGPFSLAESVSTTPSLYAKLGLPGHTPSKFGVDVFGFQPLKREETDHRSLFHLIL
jgi:hypothetical protein